MTGTSWGDGDGRSLRLCRARSSSAPCGVGDPARKAEKAWKYANPLLANPNPLKRLET